MHNPLLTGSSILPILPAVLLTPTTILPYI